MKKLLLCISILLLITVLNDSLTAQPQYYNYNTNGSNNSFPFNIAAGKEVQLLYLPGDFNQPTPAPAGNIASISILIATSYPLGPWTYTDLTIKMAQSTITSFTAGSFYAPLTTVYYRASVSLTGAAGSWMTITLDTPFTYDPTQSLIIDIGHCGAPGATGFSACFTSLTGNRRIWSVGGCPFAPYATPNNAIYHLGLNLVTSGPPVVVTTAATSVTTNSATLNGTVNANGASTAVSFEYGQTLAYGITVPGVPATVTGNTVTPVSASIAGLQSGTLYHFRAKGVNSAGTTNGNDMTFTTTGCPPPPAAGPITGSSTGCGASTGNVYSVAPIPTATGYTWSLPAGSVITAGNNTNSITVTFGNTSGNISVFGTSTCGNGLPSSKAVTIIPAPIISGVNNLCINSGTYYYSTQTGMTNYVWTISPGGTIISGQGTREIEVTWNTPGAQYVTAIFVNPSGCTPTVPTVYPVTVAAMPGTAGSISGTSNVCFGSTGVAYNVAAIDNAQSYVWSLPVGATIATGFGTNSITVNFATNASSGNITVYGNSLCGNGPLSPAYYVLVTNLPGTPLAIIGPTSVCEAETGVPFSVPPITEATGYNWTLPAGATIASGSNTESITVDFAMDASSGPIAVNGTNFCGSGPVSANLEVTVVNKPDAPVITLTGEMLSSDAPLGNQWYYNGAAITGGTAQTEPVLYSGWYWDVVTIDGCSSDTSNNIYYIVTGIEDPQASNVKIIPVPNNGFFKLALNYPDGQTFSIRIYNQIGVAVYESLDNRVKGLFEKNIDLRPVPAGIYTVVLQSADYRLVRKIIVN